MTDDTLAGPLIAAESTMPAVAVTWRWIPVRATPKLLRSVRWAAVAGWASALAIEIHFDGVPFDRESLIVWIGTGLLAATIGVRPMWTVLVDWLPFALVLLGYDFLRGISDNVGMPTWWTPQLNVDKFLFGGAEPTVWLQEHLKYAHAQWWDVVVCVTYISFFLLPYVLAGVLWLRSRTEFRRWAARFVSLSFLGFMVFVLLPSAPPWAAARCSAAQVSGHPANPACMSVGSPKQPGGGLLAAMTVHQPGALPYIERLSGRGWPALHLTAAKALIEKGQAVSNLVAAVPSLHAGGTLLVAIFLWRRVRVGWKAVLVAYNLVMAFALVYSAEHYVSDILAGWLCAVIVSVAFNRLERWRAGGATGLRRRTPEGAVDTLGPPTPTEAVMET